MGPFISTCDGNELFHLDWGSGRPVVFVHAWALSSEFFRHQLSDLTDQGFRCVAYDRRGHGRSSTPGFGYDYDTLADDLDAVLRALDLHDVTLVAHSMGGGDALRYVSRHGTRQISRAVFIAPAAPCMVRRNDNPDGLPREVVDASLALFRSDFPRWVREQSRAFFAPETSDATVEWGIDMMMRTPLRTVVECARTMADEDLRPDLARLDVPALFVHGDRDASIPFAFGEAAARLAPRARFRPYLGAPHGLPVTHAGALVRDIVHFIAET